MTRSTASRRRDDGQIIVLFAIGLVALVGMVGLVLDGSSTFAQRRAEQNAADLAAMGGANQYLLTYDTTAATAKAREIAAQNGYDHTNPGISVDVSFNAEQTFMTVDVTAPHPNTFAGVMGLTSWPVSTTATVHVGIPDTTSMGGPFIFNKDVFTDPGGEPLPQYSNPDVPFVFGDGNGDVPNSPDDIAWTCYGTCGNMDSSTVRAMVDGTSPVSVTLDPTVDFTEYIGQENNGNHATLFGEVQDYLAGEEVAVPIVDDNGLFQGWATFHVTAASQGSKQLVGYFVTPFNNNDNLEVKGCTGSCPKPRYFGTYTLELTN